MHLCIIVICESIFTYYVAIYTPVFINMDIDIEIYKHKLIKFMF